MCWSKAGATANALPEHLSEGRYAERLDAVFELRDQVEALRAVAQDLPLGFGRD